MNAHQRPWTLGAIIAADLVALKQALALRLGGDGYRRAWLVVGGDRGYWREERLCLGADGTWVVVTDGHRGAPGELRRPAHPERIPAFEARLRELIVAGRLAEGTIQVVREPGLLLLGFDVEQDAMHGTEGDRDLLEQFWRIRLAGRTARGTAPADAATTTIRRT